MQCRWKFFIFYFITSIFHHSLDQMIFNVADISERFSIHIKSYIVGNINIFKVALTPNAQIYDSSAKFVAFI